MAFRKVGANLGVHGLTDSLSIPVLHDFAENPFGKRKVHIDAGLAGIGAAHVDFDVVAGLVGNRKTFKQVLQLIFVIGKPRSFCYGHPHAKPDLVRLGQLFIGTASDDFDTLVIKPHAVVDGTVVFQETDTRTVRIAFTELAGGRTYGNAAKAHVRIVRNSLRRLVRTCRQDNGATEIQGIAVVGKSDDALESLAQVRAATHKRNKGSQSRGMLQRIVTKFRIVMENTANERQDTVAKVQVILVIHAVERHG